MAIVNLLIAAGRAFAEWRRRQRAYAELMALDDRTLADIGLPRSQIRALVFGDIGGTAKAASPTEQPDFWSGQTRLAGPSTRAGL